MDYLKNFDEWKTDTFFDEETRNEVAALSDEKEIEDRFYQDLEFGTAGLRGIMGAGTNRMNKYTVGKATAGFANYLKKYFGKEACENKGVVICFDTRNNSREFSECAANVFSGSGVKVYIMSDARPIPVLSFAIRKFGALGGVMVTASHNPKEYNGYKAYDALGCQLVNDLADKLTDEVNKIDDYHMVNFDGNNSLINKIDVTDEFVSVILGQSVVKDKDQKANLKVVYTPIHGSGFVPVTKTLEADGFSNVFVVEEQKSADGNFPTVVSPNPEDRRALELGIKLAQQVDADLVLGTDPDCDRVGTAVKGEDGYRLLTGNHIGILLIDFLMSKYDTSKFKKPAIINTIVTSEMGAQIARAKGATVFSTLTGFKYIGEKIMQFEQAKASGNSEQDYDYLLGYEESYGYLAGTHSRDKDAVVASMLIAEMAAYYKSQNKTLADRLEELYKEYGYYLDTQESFTLKGKDGLEQIKNMMQILKNSTSPFGDTSRVVDYNNPVAAEKGFGFLPTANVIKYVLSDGSWVVVRPSGTEPKIKIYYSIKGENKQSAEQRLEKIKTKIKTLMGL